MAVNCSLSLPATKENIWDSPSPQQKLCAVARIRLDAMSGPMRKLIGPAKTRVQRYVEEASSLPSSTVEEKTVTEDELRVEEVIARINTNVSLLERCNR